MRNADTSRDRDQAGDADAPDGPDSARRPTAADYAGVSPGFLRVVRWVNRIVYLGMVAATVAAISWGSGLSNDLERARIANKAKDERIFGLERAAASHAAVLDEASNSTRSGASTAKGSDVNTLAAASGEASVARFEAAALREEVSRLSLERARNERQIRVLTEQLQNKEAAEKGTATVKAPLGNGSPNDVPAAPTATPAETAAAKLDTGWATLLKNRKDRPALVNVAAALFKMTDTDSLAWLKARATYETADLVLMLIGERAPAGGDGLAHVMLSDALASVTPQTSAARFLEAASAYRGSQDSNELLASIVSTPSFSAPDRANAVVSLAWGGDSRAERWLASSWRELPAGAPERVALALAAVTSLQPGHLVTAEMALEESTSTDEEFQAAQRSFRAVIRAKDASRAAAGRERLQKLTARVGAAGMSDARMSALRVLEKELLPDSGTQGLGSATPGAITAVARSPG